MSPNQKSVALPRMSRDRSFWGMTTTQFLGAFNDNLFKQLVLLLCIDYAIADQSVAMALFALPFVLFSGFGGYLSDRLSKRRIVVTCKIAEIGVMLAGLAAFLAAGSNPSILLILLFAILFFMGMQSAFFGPSKYGILPELFREEDLPAVNGAVQMTTFVAIIFGMALAGFAKDWFEERLWIVSLICVGIAIAGTMTSLLIRRTRPADPDLTFQPSSLTINKETRALLRRDRSLLGVVLVSSLFWFVGGVVQAGINAFGVQQMNYGDSRSSMMAACLGVGIAAGCVIAAKASHKRVNFRLVTIGSGGVAASLVALTIVGLSFDAVVGTPGREPLWELLSPRFEGELIARIVLTTLGVFAGLFVVPLQVYLQTRPPADQKGRMIGAMNLVNWI
ncbi:MAG: MFS transporter, partial [Planctomycetes bacterium]|nr:MFS transporter [Planctomycetota bacterium]